MESREEFFEADNPRKLSKLLKQMLKEAEDCDIYKVFRTLPNPKEAWAQNYREVIRNIIDLNTIRSKTERHGYTHLSLLDDLQLLYENTKQFNGESNQLTIKAQEMLNKASAFAREHSNVSGRSVDFVE